MAKSYLNLPSNPDLRAKATKLRKAGNLSEVLFWNKVKKNQLFGLDFDRQKIIGNFIVDFYCPEINLVIEINGESHDFKGKYDQDRQLFLRSLGLIVLNIEDIRIKKDLENVIVEVFDLCKMLKNTVC